MTVSRRLGPMFAAVWCLASADLCCGVQEPVLSLVAAIAKPVPYFDGSFAQLYWTRTPVPGIARVSIASPTPNPTGAGPNPDTGSNAARKVASGPVDGFCLVRRGFSWNGQGDPRSSCHFRLTVPLDSPSPNIARISCMSAVTEPPLDGPS